MFLFVSLERRFGWRPFSPHLRRRGRRSSASPTVAPTTGGGGDLTLLLRLIVSPSFGFCRGVTTVAGSTLHQNKLALFQPHPPRSSNRCCWEAGTPSSSRQASDQVILGCVSWRFLSSMAMASAMIECAEDLKRDVRIAVCIDVHLH